MKYLGERFISFFLSLVVLAYFSRSLSLGIQLLESHRREVFILRFEDICDLAGDSLDVVELQSLLVYLLVCVDISSNSICIVRLQGCSSVLF